VVPEIALIEWEDFAGGYAVVLGVECAINVVEDDTGLIIVAAVDEIALIFVARLPVIDRDLRMTGANGALKKQTAAISTTEIMQIKAVCGIAHFRIDDRVIVTSEDVNALMNDVPGIVDVAAPPPFIGFVEERLEVGRRALHAGAGRRQLRD